MNNRFAADIGVGTINEGVLVMNPINIKAMLALIEKDPGDQYVPVLKPVLMQILTELKHLRRKNSQLGGKVARYRREKEELEDALAMYQ